VPTRWSALPFLIFACLFVGAAFLVLDKRSSYLKLLDSKLDQLWAGSSRRFVRAIRFLSGLAAAGLFLLAIVTNFLTWHSDKLTEHTSTLM